MKDRLKKALKRAASGLMAVLLAVCLVGTPRAKAVVSEGALLGSIFGSLLVSMGYSWAADNMDAPTFGDSIYKLTKEFDDAMQDTGSQLIRDLSLAGLTANGAGKLQFGYAWVQAARSFAQWFQGKFFDSSASNSAIVYSSNFAFTAEHSVAVLNYPYSLIPKTTFSQTNNFVLQFSKIPITQSGSYTYTVNTSIAKGELWPSQLCFYVGGSRHPDDTGSYYYAFCDSGPDSYTWTFTPDEINSGVTLDIWFTANSTTGYKDKPITISNYACLNIGQASSLTAEKPQEVHYPDVAEDGSQVYEITVDGVTATDIEGIVQGAVDRILAGTAAIAGEVAQVGTGEIVENPEIDPYKVGLSSVFPFCIPFDVYNMVTMFVAEPEAPSAEWSFTLPWSNQEYSVGWDLAAFDGVARVCRDMELVLFAVGLAVITYKVIKW